MLFDPPNPPTKSVDPTIDTQNQEATKSYVDSLMAADSSQLPATPEQTAEPPKFLRRLRSVHPTLDDLSIPSPCPAPTVSQTEVRKVVLESVRGTPYDRFLDLVVELSKIVAGFQGITTPAPTAPTRATAWAPPEYPRIQGRPALPRCGEVFSPSGEVIARFDNTAELARVVGGSYSGVSAKIQAAFRKAGKDSLEHDGLEFTYKGYRIIISPNVAPRS
jgi:hypothetical protein